MMQSLGVAFPDYSGFSGRVLGLNLAVGTFQGFFRVMMLKVVET